MKARKSKQIQTPEKLRLTRVLSLESIFDRNYDRLWRDVAFELSAEIVDKKTGKKPAKPAWNKRMSDGLAENNAEMVSYVSPENISSMIRERLNYIDIRKLHNNILTAQTYFLDDNMANNDDSDIDTLFGKSKFGVSRKESADNLKELADLTDIDKTDDDEEEDKIDITSLSFSFLGEKNEKSPPQNAQKKPTGGKKPAQKPIRPSAIKPPPKPVAPAVTADPNDELLDMAAWGLTDEDDAPMPETPDINMDMDINIAPAQQMPEAHQQPPASNTISTQNATSSDIVSVDNLLKNIGYHEKQAAPHQQDMPENNNYENNNYEEPPLQADSHLHITKNQSQTTKADEKQALQALKAQKRAEKQAEKQMKQAQKEARKTASRAEKQAQKTQKHINKKRSIRDILRENSEKTGPLTADEVALQAEFGGMASADSNTDHAENILEKINQPSGNSSANSTPHYQQIQKTFDNNPLATMDLPPDTTSLPQTPEHQKAAVSELKNLLGTANNTNSKTASSDNILENFANLQQKMAEKMSKT